MLSVAQRERLEGVIAPQPGPFDFARARQTLAEIDAIEPAQLSREDLRLGMQRLDMMRCRIEATMARLLAEDASRSEPGQPLDGRMECTTRWMRTHLHLSSSAAYAQVRGARTLQELTATAGALARGEISVRQASVICRAMDEYRAHGLDGELREGVESQLLQHARTMDPGELLKEWYHIRYQIDQEAGRAAEEELRQQRWFRLKEQSNGRYHLEGELDPESGAVLKTALHAVMKKRPANDRRPADHRRADALVHLARRPMNDGRLPRRGGQKPHLTVIADLDTLRLEPGSRLAQLDWGIGITGDSARRIGCDSTITPVGVKKGSIVHVGRATRSVSPRTRKALNVRDRHCQAPGCTVPAADCEPHHVEHWADSGRTEYGNLRLYCDTHHRELHPENQRFYRLPP